MAKYPKKDYKFLRFEKSKRKDKKYDAVLQNKQTNREVRVPFGAIGYEQFRDSTGLGLYTKDNHGDKVRKRSYRSRHSKEMASFKEFYSPGFFAMRYLWT
jgi:hypothetical protein